MKKRILAVMLITAMTATLAAGCGKSSDGQKEDKKESGKLEKQIWTDIKDELCEEDMER